MKGRILSHDVVQIFTEFQEFFAVFANSTYDSLNHKDLVRSQNIVSNVLVVKLDFHALHFSERLWHFFTATRRSKELKYFNSSENFSSMKKRVVPANKRMTSLRQKSTVTAWRNGYGNQAV